MPTYQDFKNSVLPGNYALTKSMELTKIETSGTLWYTKKYLVLYYYIFLSNDIFSREFVNKATAIFDNYIESLDERVRARASRFFYPDNSSQNMKSDSFKSFLAFANKTEFSSNRERAKYYNDARKCYFALLMGSGGQSAVKEAIITGIKSNGFNYSKHNIKQIIDSSIPLICAAKFTDNEIFESGDLPRILSQKAIEEIQQLEQTVPNLEIQISDIIQRYPCSREYPGRYKGHPFISAKYLAVEKDAFASIRNERQILYYYGYFHSRSINNNEREFSSLTPIGEAALIANSQEFLAIWEHQKIKMISQPVTAEINLLSNTVNDSERFGISFNPYTDILGYILRNNSISISEYKYIVSRRKHEMTENEWCDIEPELKENISDLEALVRSFRLKRDIENENGRKELLKYILGIRADIPADDGTNSFNIINVSNRSATAVDHEGLTRIYDIYSRLCEYKAQKYQTLFEECEQDLRNRYVEACRGNIIRINARTKVDWDLYNIHIDKFIILGVILSIVSHKCNVDISNVVSTEDCNNLVQLCQTDFSQLLRCINLRTRNEIRREINKFVNAISERDYSYFTGTDGDRAEIIAEYRTTGAEDLLAHIRNISNQATVDYTEGRTRNASLIAHLKSYYLQSYSENSTLRCECCNEEAFITGTGQPYVEFHHLIPFNIAYGPDHYLNLFALCPKCHRKIHHINLNEKAVLYRNLNQNNYLELTFVQRLITLKGENLIRSYHLEFLLVDNAITEDEYNTVAAA